MNESYNANESVETVRQIGLNDLSRIRLDIADKLANQTRHC